MSKFELVILGFLIFGTSLQLLASDSLRQRFRSLDWSSDGRICHYRLYIPEGVSSKKSWPLLVWLHGNPLPGETDVAINWLSLVFRSANGSPPLFIFAPENETKQPWFTPAGDQKEALAFVSQCLDDLLTKYPIDRDRIYLVGISAGGSACWQLLSRRPETFAAAAPLGAEGGEESLASRIASVPIWAFHARDDGFIPIDADRALVAAIKSSDGTAELTETEPRPGVSSSHDCWTAAFQQYKLFDWLLAQRRGVPVTVPPGETGKVKLTSSLKKGFDSVTYVGLSVVVWMIVGYVVWLAWQAKRSGSAS